MAIPKPGKSVRGSKTGRPSMALLDLLGRRWALRILWELRVGPCTFRQLQGACEGMSPSVLNQRLKELRETELVVLRDDGYELTRLGNELRELLVPLDRFAKRWAKQLGR